MSRIIKFENPDNCAPCESVEKHLKDKGVEFEKVNPFEDPKLARRYSVRSVPTVIKVINDGVDNPVRGQDYIAVMGYNPVELNSLVN